MADIGNYDELDLNKFSDEELEQNVFRALTPPPPDFLYHYTTQSGLLGIIRDREIWATHTQYLSDTKEYLHALNMVNDEINRKIKMTGDKRTTRLLMEMLQGTTEIQTINVCVCSFSLVKDSLSQWRAYGDQMSGFAIGFSGDFLLAVAKQERGYLAPCIYEEQDQINLIQLLVEMVLRQNLASNEDDGESTLPLGGNLQAYLHRYAPIIKHRSFAEEKEWRIINRPISVRRDGFDFRQGNSMLIPYYRLPLVLNDEEFTLKEVVVGPTPHMTEATRSVFSFLVSQKLDKTTPLTQSQVPYRNW